MCSTRPRARSRRRCHEIHPPQVTRELLTTLALLLGLALAGMYALIWVNLVDAFDSALRARAQAVSALTEFDKGKLQFDFSEDFLRGFSGKKPRHYFEIMDAKGARLSGSPSLGTPRLGLSVVGTEARPRLENVPLPSGRPSRAISLCLRRWSPPATR